MKFPQLFWIALLLLAPLAFARHTPAPASSSASSRLALAQGWTLQSSSKIAQTGEVLSKPGFRPKAGMK